MLFMALVITLRKKQHTRALCTKEQACRQEPQTPRAPADYVSAPGAASFGSIVAL